MKIYVASSWRNTRQPSVVEALRADGHDVYDFKNPEPGNQAFAWSEIDPNWQTWTEAEYLEALSSEIAIEGFRRDERALTRCETCVLVLPCGRSAHLEAGYAIGLGIPLVILLPNGEPMEPELMYRWAAWIGSNLDALRMECKEAA